MDTEQEKEQTQIGKDFLTYLCYKGDINRGLLQLSRHGQISLWVDGKIVFEDDTIDPRDTIFYTGNSFSSRALKEAIKNSKKVSEARFSIEKDNNIWSFTLRAPNLAVAGLKLPISHLRSEDHESRFYTRIISIEKLNAILDELFNLFLEEVYDKAWHSQGYVKLQQWLKRR
jgi:hypothetical protein